MRSGMGFVLIVIVCVLAWRERGEAANIADECSEEFTKVTECLNFVTGKAAAPTAACCTAVKGIRNDDPKCLCYFIQQTHNGSEAIKSLGIQESRLLQLSSACQLKNASLSDCPGLLGLSPSSPDAAIFLNTTFTTPATTTSSPGTTSSPDKAHGSRITVHGFHTAGPLLAVVGTVFFYVFSAGSVSMFFNTRA